MNHTKGPYVVINSHRGVPHIVCEGPVGGLIARCDTGKSAAENQANANLLAAAPDLLAALVRMLDERNPFVSDCDSCECGENGSGFDDDGNACEHIQACRAIAKATGKS